MEILVVDDDAVSRAVLEATLDDLGHGCLVAADGHQAWDLYLEHRPAVVISDRLMPGMDGLALCRRIRAAADDQYTYVILLTALTERDQALQGMEAGADDYLTKPLDAAELRLRLVAAGRVTGLHDELLEQRAELRTLNELLHNSARTDPLTGLGNRLSLHEDLVAMQGRVRRYGHRFSAAMLDIDDFKSFNDTYGHTAGDQALRAVAAVIASECRSGDTVYRYGGEEFLFVLPEQGPAGAAAAVERMFATVRDLAITHAGRPDGIATLSAGVADLTEALVKGSLDDVVARADAALYRAKRGGRDQVVLDVEAPADR